MAKEKGEKNYTRREVLKAGAKATGAGIVYGTFGGFLGKAYQTARDAIYGSIKYTGNKLVDLDNKVEALPKYHPEKIPKEVHQNGRGKIYNRLFNRTEQKQEEWREKHKINRPKDSEYEPTVTRRGFLKSLLGIANKYPTATGITTGTTYGAGKSLLNGRTKFKQNVEMGKLKNRINYLENQANNQTPPPTNNSNTPEGGLEKTLLIMGFIGLLISIAISTSNLTGFSISTFPLIKSKILSITFFLISLTLLFLSKRLR